jgi:ribonuclease-3
MSADPRVLVETLLGADGALTPELLERALTHRSAGRANNERLEFLGDAALGLVMAEALCDRFPDADEGELSRRRAALVNKDSLAAVARELRLGDYLRLGAGELRTGGHARDSILADALEAVIGAVHADLGLDAVRSMLLRIFAASLERVASREAVKDPKTRLQEWLQARRRPVPEYGVVQVSGAAHDQRFVVICKLTDVVAETTGEGGSRRRAEQDAAAGMLAELTAADGDAGAGR